MPKEATQSDSEQPQEAAGEKEYILAKESEASEVIVDDKSITKSGGAVSLTQDQYERASAAEGVVLVDKEQTS